jgi:hypothetical protein
MREQSKHKRTTEMKSRETIEYKGLGGGVVYLYYGGEEDDKTIKVSSQAEAEKIAMENGAEHWDYVKD